MTAAYLSKALELCPTAQVYFRVSEKLQGIYIMQSEYLHEDYELVPIENWYLDAGQIEAVVICARETDRTSFGDYHSRLWQ